MLEGLSEVQRNIEEAYRRRKTAVLFLCNKYKLIAENTLKDSQGTAKGKGQFWTNQTSNAIRNVKGFAIDKGDSVSFGIAHRMEYGIYLELANNRKHAALEKTMNVVIPFFMADVKKVYEG